MKKTFISAVMCAMLMLGSAFMPAQSVALEKEGPGMYQHSVTGDLKYFDSHPGSPSQWNLVTPNGGDNGCTGPNCSATGNFDISVFAKDGGLSGDIEIIPNGIAGGFGLTGGVAGGSATGEVKTGKTYGWIGPNWYNYGWKTVDLGKTSADIEMWAGGVTKTVSESFNPNVGDIGIGVSSYTHNTAVTGGELKGSVFGLGYSGGAIVGITGQKSFNGSLLTGSPLSAWKSTGVTYGVAGQSSLGGFTGYGISAGFGSYDVEADIYMSGMSGSESWRAIDFFEGGKTEYMGTIVFANTLVETTGYAKDTVIAEAGVDGGFTAKGDVATKTTQSVNGGTAVAKANGGYTGYGSLNCNFLGSAVGYSQTSATTLDGYNGSIMGANAGMTVNVQNTTGSIVD